jgi:hypothetical protein
MNTDRAPLGLVRGMSNLDYHGVSEAIGSTGLRKLAKSPLHFFGATLDPDRPAAKTSDAMSAGTLAHCALLEPLELLKRYAVKPDGQDGRTKEGKAWIEANIGREAISAEQLQTAQRQAASIRALPEIGPLLAKGEAEVSAFWIDRSTGMRCKVRPDWVHRVPAIERDDLKRGVVLLDLKTARDASARGFSRSIWDYRYDIQAAFYADGYEQASGLMVLGFVFIVVEDWPHAAAAYMLDDVVMDRARVEIRALLDLYAECKRADVWPGYIPTIQPISLPSWAR